MKRKNYEKEAIYSCGIACEHGECSRVKNSAT